MKVFYLIGMPGSGKTTVARKLVRMLPHKNKEDFVFLPRGGTQARLRVKYTIYKAARSVCQIGHNRGPFAGTDSLDKAVQPPLQDWLINAPFEYVFAEGDRLGNAKFFQFLIDSGVDLTVAALMIDNETAQRRREKREASMTQEQRGLRRSNTFQSETWIAGRRTKIDNLVSQFVDDDWILDGGQDPILTAQQIALHPVGRRFDIARTIMNRVRS